VREKLVSDIYGYIDDNFKDTLLVSDIAYNFHYSLSQVQHVFKSITGKSINSEINNKRIISSLCYLENTDDNLLKISLLCGFSSLEYFSRRFSNTFGISPSEYRKLHKIGPKTEKEILKYKRVLLLKEKLYVPYKMLEEKGLYLKR